MITARWLGGPYDGAELVLADQMPVQIPTRTDPPRLCGEFEVETEAVYPRLTRLGWVLDWPYEKT